MRVENAAMDAQIPLYTNFDCLKICWYKELFFDKLDKIIMLGKTRRTFQNKKDTNYGFWEKFFKAWAP